MPELAALDLKGSQKCGPLPVRLKFFIFNISDIPKKAVPLQKL
jgi:hypothetical protein